MGLRARNALASFDDVIIEGLSYTDKTQYRYNDKTGALMHELDASGNITTSYVADAHGRLVSVTRALNTENPSTFFYHYNAHGDVVAITNADGSIVARFSYDPWGMPTELDPAGTVVTIGSWTASTGGTPGDGLFILFGGMLYDAAAGLYLTKTRAYNPKTGRFLQRDILDEDAKDGYDGFPFGKDAIGTNLYAWCGNNPVNMVDPSGMFGEGISAGTLRLAQTAQNLSTTAVSYHEGCYGLPPSRSGGYAFAGYTAGNRARAQQKSATRPPPEKVFQYVSRAPSWEKTFLNTSAGRAFYNLTGASSFDSGTGHRKTRNQVIVAETFKADGAIDIYDKDQGGKEVGEYYHWYHSNVEAPMMATAGVAGIGTGIGLELGCISAGAGVGGIVCAPASAGVVAGSGAFAYGNYELWKDSATYNAVSWIWGD
jgi:RHS repeat-associated protein